MSRPATQGMTNHRKNQTNMNQTKNHHPLTPSGGGGTIGEEIQGEGSEAVSKARYEQECGCIVEMETITEATLINACKDHTVPLVVSIPDPEFEQWLAAGFGPWIAVGLERGWIRCPQ